MIRHCDQLILQSRIPQLYRQIQTNISDKIYRNTQASHLKSCLENKGRSVTSQYIKDMFLISSLLY